MGNIKTKVNLGGRPYKFTDPVELQERLEKYFNETERSKWTVTGLALSLGCEKDTLLNYELDRNNQSENVPTEVIRLIKEAKLLVHNAYELDLRKKGRSGDIFALKNFGWRDQQHTDITSDGKSLQPVLVQFIDEKNNSNTS